MTGRFVVPHVWGLKRSWISEQFWGRSGVVLGSFWGYSGVVMGSSWGRSAAVLGSFWSCSGVVLESFWGRSGIVLGSLWSCSEVVLGSFRTLFFSLKVQGFVFRLEICQSRVCFWSSGFRVQGVPLL